MGATGRAIFPAGPWRSQDTQHGFIRGVAGLCVVERFDCRQARRVAVATLVGFAAAETLTIALLGSDRGAMDDVFGPLRRGLDPVDQFAGMIPPLQVFFRV